MRSFVSNGRGHMQRLLIAFCTMVASTAFAQDFLSVAPGARVLKDDGKIRVIDFQARAGMKIPLHSHPTMVVYLIQGGGVRFTLQDGRTVDSSTATGAALINPPVTHSQEHLADSRAILVEIAEGATFPPAPSGPDLFAVGAGHVRLLKETDRIRVYEYAAKKGDKVPMHSHPAHVVYLLDAGQTQFTLADGTKPKPGKVKDGDAVINPPVMHAQEHLEDVRGIVIEVKR
jgi:quercetin dioxygenase-like cupin family protein